MVRARVSALALSLAFAAAAPLGALALDAPHDFSSPLVDCSGCHKLHNAVGSALTELANANLCDSCHQNSTRYGFPWTDTDQAVPGVSGSSHNWEAYATNLGATPPSLGAGGAEAEMAKRLAAGKLQCSVCHDQHGANVYKGTLKTSIPIGVATTPTSGGTGRTLTLNQPGPAAVAKGYWIRICTGGASFQISHDRTTSWFSYSGGTWSAGSLNANCKAITADSGNPVLDDPAVSVRFAGTFAENDYWDFYVSYPFLRADNTESAMCLICHKDRNQGHTTVINANAAYPVNGTNVFHHPVGNSLNANGGGYDRGDSTTNNVLDAHGAVQASNNDGISSNDILLGASNKVHCLSCHRIHNADSNGATEFP